MNFERVRDHVSTRNIAIAAGSLATAGAIAASGMWLRQRHAPVYGHLEDDFDRSYFEQQAAILNDPRFEPEKLVALNYVAAKILMTPGYPTRAEIKESLGLGLYQTNQLLGHLSVRHLIEKKPARRLHMPVPVHYAPTPILGWAASQPEQYSLLAEMTICLHTDITEEMEQ